jgi:hypothetical protein
VRLSHEDLPLLAAVTQRPKELARLVASAIIAGHVLDFRIERHARDYVAVACQLRGDEIVREVVMRIAWADLDESTRFGVLQLVATQAILSAERTIGRAKSTVAVVSRSR